jgi:hypothetical protein
METRTAADAANTCRSVSVLGALLAPGLAIVFLFYGSVALCVPIQGMVAGTIP